LILLARSASEHDPLVSCLARWASAWPLSSVGIRGVMPENVEALLDHPGLAQLYMDRILAKKDWSRVSDGRIADLLRRTIGALPLLMVVGASNRLPEDDALTALFDRFLLRVQCDNVPDKQMADVLTAGWTLDQGQENQGQGGMPSTLSVAEIQAVQALVGQVELAPVRPAYIETITRLRSAGIPVSDRRPVKLQKLVAASAVLCGRRPLHAARREKRQLAVPRTAPGPLDRLGCNTQRPSREPDYS
jgi:hypothetical protein